MRLPACAVGARLIAARAWRRLGSKDDEMLTDSVDAPLPTALVLAAANSLIVLDGKVFGDPLERAALDWSTDDAGAAAWELKRNGRVSSPSLGVTASNVARHHFDSVVKRMSVIANLEGEGSPGRVCH